MVGYERAPERSCGGGVGQGFVRRSTEFLKSLLFVLELELGLGEMSVDGWIDGQ